MLFLWMHFWVHLWRKFCCHFHPHCCLHTGMMLSIFGHPLVLKNCVDSITGTKLSSLPFAFHSPHKIVVSPSGMISSLSLFTIVRIQMWSRSHGRYLQTSRLLSRTTKICIVSTSRLTSYEGRGEHMSLLSTDSFPLGAEQNLHLIAY